MDEATRKQMQELLMQMRTCDYRDLEGKPLTESAAFIIIKDIVGA